MTQIQKEKDILLTLDYLPHIFNLIELLSKLDDICGIYNKKFNKNEYKISHKIVYKYLNKYCEKLSQGQWQKRVDL